MCIGFCMMCNYSHAQNVCYDSIRTAIVNFLTVTEPSFKDRGAGNILLLRDYVSNYQIGNAHDSPQPGFQMGEEVKEGIYSIFPMSTFSEYTYHHILLVGENEFKIINMRNSLMDNLKLVVAFLSDNPRYSKDESLSYINDFIRTSEANGTDMLHYNHITKSMTPDCLYLKGNDCKCKCEEDNISD